MCQTVTCFFITKVNKTLILTSFFNISNYKNKQKEMQCFAAANGRFARARDAIATATKLLKPPQPSYQQQPPFRKHNNQTKPSKTRSQKTDNQLLRTSKPKPASNAIFSATNSQNRNNPHIQHNPIFQPAIERLRK